MLGMIVIIPRAAKPMPMALRALTHNLRRYRAGKARHKQDVEVCGRLSARFACGAVAVAAPSMNLMRGDQGFGWKGCPVGQGERAFASARVPYADRWAA